MKQKKYQLQQVGTSGSYSRYALVAEGVSRVTDSTTIEQQYGKDTSFLGSGEVGDATTGILETSDGKLFEYVNYGDDNDMPYTLQQLLRRNMVAQRAMAFNVQCCYGQGVRFMDRETKQDTTDSEIRDFCLKNSIHEVFMQQATDMKFFFWSVEVIILSRDHSKIVNIRHKDVSYCRLEVPNDKGRIEHVFFGDFRNVMSPVHTEVIPLLDLYDPLGDLMARMGKRICIRCRARYSAAGNPASVELNDATPFKIVNIVRRIPFYDYDMLDTVDEVLPDTKEVNPRATIFDNVGEIANPTRELQVLWWMAPNNSVHFENAVLVGHGMSPSVPTELLDQNRGAILALEVKDLEPLALAVDADGKVFVDADGNPFIFH